MAKRFYETVTTSPSENGFHVLLDGRVLKTPGKKTLLISSQKRAQLVAEEWLAQTGDIDPNSMPCTRLLNVACEITPTRPADLCAEFVKYSQSDLLNFRAQHPRDLAARQDEYWQPVLDWAQQKHAIELVNTNALDAPQHPRASQQHALAYAQNFCHEKLTLLLHYTGSYGSAILAMAVMEKHLDAKTAYGLSVLDEIFQNERSGIDDEAQARNADICSELEILEKLV